MPKATKEKTEKNQKENLEKSTKKTVSTEKKAVTKKTTNKSGSTKKAAKSSAPKKDTTKKKSTTAKKSVSKSSAATKSKSAKTTVKKPAAKKVASTTLKKPSFLSEYYDLPYKYNKTVVKILAQTPTKLFIYWEISDDDRNNFIKNYGDDFFNVTKPVLIIHNLTMNYSFELDINDFANSWYISINDADCLYGVELGRKPFSISEKIQTPYIYVSSSNNLQTPNNHILFENLNSNTVFKFKNVKTKSISYKPITNLKFIANGNKFYNTNDFYNLYQKFYGENLLKELNSTKLNNPSSGAISSFK